MFLKKMFKIFRKDVMVNPDHGIATSSLLGETGRDKGKWTIGIFHGKN